MGIGPRKKMRSGDLIAMTQLKTLCVAHKPRWWKGSAKRVKTKGGKNSRLSRPIQQQEVPRQEQGCHPTYANIGCVTSETFRICMPASAVLCKEHWSLGQVVEIGPVLLFLSSKSLVQGFIIVIYPIRDGGSLAWHCAHTSEPSPPRWCTPICASHWIEVLLKGYHLMHLQLGLSSNRRNCWRTVL